jgi:hypothetical protein
LTEDQGQEWADYRRGGEMMTGKEWLEYEERELCDRWVPFQSHRERFVIMAALLEIARLYRAREEK